MAARGEDTGEGGDPPQRIVTGLQPGGIGDLSRQGTTLSQTGYVVFMRGLALFGMLFGVNYWLRLIGWEDGANWRFDEMSLAWRAAATALAVLYPFAASGLWMLANWGIVTWFICGGVEIVMFTVFAQTFGWRPLLVLFHLLIVVLYVFWRFHLRAQRRRLGRTDLVNGP